MKTETQPATQNDVYGTLAEEIIAWNNVSDEDWLKIEQLLSDMPDYLSRLEAYEDLLECGEIRWSLKI